MTKQVTTDKSTGRVTEHFFNFKEGISGDISASQGHGDIRHAEAINDYLAPRRELVDIETPPDQVYAFAFRPRLSPGDNNNNVYAITDDGLESQVITYPDMNTISGSWSVLGTLSNRAVLNAPSLFFDNKVWFFYDDSRLGYATPSGITEGVLTGMNRSDQYFFENNTALQEKIQAFSACVHPSSNILYIGSQQQISQVDADTNATLTALPLIESGRAVTSVTPYNEFLAIGQYDFENNASKILLWNLATDVENRYVETFEAGSGILVAMAELNGYLVYILAEVEDSAGEFTKMTINRFAGGQVQTVREIHQDDVLFGGQWRFNQPRTDGSKLYFTGLSGGNTSDNMFIYSVDYEGRLKREFETSGSFISTFLIQNNRCMISDPGNNDVSLSAETDIYGQESTYVTQEVVGYGNGEEGHLVSIRIAHQPAPIGCEISCTLIIDDTRISLGEKTPGEDTRATFFTRREDGTALPKFYTALVEIKSTGGIKIGRVSVMSEPLNNQPA